jgi:alkylation response protein AidB-like acyl-CoA dehydrogenase
VFNAVGALWDTVLRGDLPTTRQTAMVRLACSHAARECAQAVEGLFEAAGTAMSDASHPLARCFRDAHVVGQHLMVSPHAIDDAGRVLLGLDPLSAAF